MTDEMKAAMKRYPSTKRALASLRSGSKIVKQHGQIAGDIYCIDGERPITADAFGAMLDSGLICPSGDGLLPDDSQTYVAAI